MPVVDLLTGQLYFSPSLLLPSPAARPFMILSSDVNFSYLADYPFELGHVA